MNKNMFLTGNCADVTQCGHIQPCPRMYVQVMDSNCESSRVRKSKKKTCSQMACGL